MHEEFINILKEDDIVEPETVRHMYPNETDAEINKILAFVTLSKTRHFWENFLVFEKIVLALNGIMPDFNMLQGVMPEQIWYALEIAHKLYPTREYAPEILKYIEYICNEHGVYVYPPYLEMPNPYYESAYKLAHEGPFPLGDASPEEIQASKLLAILAYVEEKQK